jgi:predicted nucleic acid-binding protein
MSRRVVIDASALLEVVLTGARALELVELLTGAEDVMAPDLFHCEVANALWKYVRAGVIGAEEAVALYERAVNLVDMVVPDEELSKEALVTAAAQGHPVYDMCYAVLARREGGTVCTLDKAFARALADMSIPVVCPGL